MPFFGPSLPAIFFLFFCHSGRVVDIPPRNISVPWAILAPGEADGAGSIADMIHKDLNRRLLWSHCLSKKMKGRDAPVRVADACCGIQSHAVRESLSSFWARIDGFRNADVLSELKPGGGLVRTWAVRYTMHTIPSKDYVYILGGAARE